MLWRRAQQGFPHYKYLWGTICAIEDVGLRCSCAIGFHGYLSEEQQHKKRVDIVARKACLVILEP